MLLLFADYVFPFLIIIGSVISVAAYFAHKGDQVSDALLYSSPAWQILTIYTPWLKSDFL